MCRGSAAVSGAGLVSSPLVFDRCRVQDDTSRMLHVSSMVLLSDRKQHSQQRTHTRYLSQFCMSFEELWVILRTTMVASQLKASGQKSLTKQCQNNYACPSTRPQSRPKLPETLPNAGRLGICILRDIANDSFKPRGPTNYEIDHLCILRFFSAFSRISLHLFRLLLSASSISGSSSMRKQALTPFQANAAIPAATARQLSVHTPFLSFSQVTLLLCPGLDAARLETCGFLWISPSSPSSKVTISS